ncbi:hypothetical protein FHR99_003254 [Litorivivens lipolytica]|uniref:Uncharacterized protein n=1 Tax=Litorivivens lipolytica TaxID=1524264 RepID=A0A7W4Z8F9_9GAMM|nr:hypothetical protein [Litorivivens lipolytica]
MRVISSLVIAMCIDNAQAAVYKCETVELHPKLTH